MRFGSREVCNVTIKDITNKKPVIYLETLKMNSIETGSDTVYATGGQGVPRLIGWNGKKQVKFKNEEDRKSTRLNSSHANISYAVFCLKKKQGEKEDLRVPSLALWR